MTDIPYRVYGPRPLHGGLGETLYTAPTGTSKFFIRDLTFSNVDPSNNIHVHISLGSISNPDLRVIDQNMTAATATFIRPLWLMDAGETLQGLQQITAATTMTSVANVASAVDASSFATGTWTPAANTMYVLVQGNGVASGTTALNPNSITGNGSWTLINQTTSTVSTARNVGVSAWYWFSTSAGSLAATTIAFASTQHSFNGAIFSIANVYSGTTAVSPWTSTATPIVQSAVAADTTAPASTTDTKTVTLASAIQTGYVFYINARGSATNGGTTAPTGYTEATGTGADWSLADASGSVCALLGDVSSGTTPPITATTVGPGTYAGGGTTDARAAVAWEMVPGSSTGGPAWVNCMVSGIEVH